MSAQSYSFTNIDYPGGLYVNATGLNDSGDVVGTYQDSNYNTHGFLYTGGTAYSSIDYPGASQTWANGINDNGVITGHYEDSSGLSHGFLDDNGAFSSFDCPNGLGTPGGIGTYAYGINNSNQVVGNCFTFLNPSAAAADVAFLYSNGSFSFFNSPLTFAFPTGINNSGQIVGDYAFGGCGGFLYSAGTYTDIDYPGAGKTCVTGINDAGVIVGWYSEGSVAGWGFLWSAGQYTTINTASSINLNPGLMYLQINGINNMGQIVGFYYPAQGTSENQNYLATPIAPPVPLRFVPVTPCRVVDTRNAAGPFGGPSITGGGSRSFAIPNGACGIPSTAQAYSLNAAMVPTGHGWITLWPTGQPEPLAASVNSPDGRVKSDGAIVPAGTGGAISVYASVTTQVVLDINGYFVPAAGNPTALAFYPVTPCRVADTRNAAGSLGGPYMSGGSTRTFPILAASACGIPSSAQAFSLNLAVVPLAGRL
ncbi:MAG: hypothetical protein WBL61_01230, partial [Bryobacteraceae bacterium]